jgi:hypothetical protein
MSKAIVIREHVLGRDNRCAYCALSAHQLADVECEPRLAAVPDGYEGETVEVDENTAAFLAGRKPAIPKEAQLAEMQQVGKDGRPGSSAAMTFCERCHAYILTSNFERHCAELHP